MAYITRTQEPQELIVWTNMGRSLIFENVVNLQFHTQGFEFDYYGVSTNKFRHANFNNTSVSGYALTGITETASCK